MILLKYIFGLILLSNTTIRQVIEQPFGRMHVST